MYRLLTANHMQLIIHNKYSSLSRNVLVVACVCLQKCKIMHIGDFYRTMPYVQNLEPENPGISLTIAIHIDSKIKVR